MPDAVSSPKGADDALELCPHQVNRVHLVDGSNVCCRQQQPGERGVALGLRQQRDVRLRKASLVTSIKATATSLLDAPVTMLRAYCSCPGASAMMNLRFGVAK